MITATVVYYSAGPYGPVQHTAGRTALFTHDDVKRAVINYDSVFSRHGAQHIVIDRDTRIAFQVSGYNRRRGAFVDVLPRDELLPYISDNNQARSGRDE